ncbi:MAG TPA: hypothetical protein VJT83_09165 [Chitinophagaceae bacterium]|nr:hypothetical protein [Chitinophagaceae bacterium]
MKIYVSLIASMIIVSASCNNNAVKPAEKNSSANAPEQKVNTASANLPQGMENIVGHWELVKVFGDKNGNHKVEPAEEAQALAMEDYMKLNADGTCEYTMPQFTGRYEIKNMDDGRKKLIVYDRTGAETNKGRYIISVTEKELVINKLRGGSDFLIFKRK